MNGQIADRQRVLIPPRAVWAGALCAGLLVGLLAVTAQLVLSGQVHVGQSGFLVYYSAGRLVLTGHGAALYDPSLLAAIERPLLAPIPLGHSVSPFLYPPFAALLFSPFAALPYGVSLALWTVLNLGVLAGVLEYLRRYSKVSAPVWTLAAISFLPTFIALAQGQVSILLLAVFAGVHYLLRRGRPGAAGAVLALGLIKAPYVLPFLLVLLLGRRWRALAAFAGASAVLCAFPTVLLGLSVDRGLITLLGETGRWHGYGFSPAWNQGFSGFAGLLLPAGFAIILTGLLDLAALALLARATLQSHRLDLPIALAAVVALLVSPHVLIHDLVVLLLPVAIAYRYHRDGPQCLSPLLAGGYLAIAAGLPLVHLAPIQLSVPAMCALGLWLIVTRQRRATRRNRGHRTFNSELDLVSAMWT